MGAGRVCHWGAEKTKLIVKTLKCQYLLGFIQGLERKRKFFPGIMAIFHGIVQLFDHFFQGLQQPFPNFPPQRCFFSISQSNFWVFFVSSDHFDFCGLSTGSWWKTRTSTWVAKIQNLASYIFWCLSYAFLVQISNENFIEPTLHNVGF